MSENIPESIPTSHDPRSKRPTKRRALSPTGQQAAIVDALFAQPEREIKIPDSSTPTARTLAPPPEIVQNVQGSSAGAGSGEFHVYKASRRREYERLKAMDEETQKERDEAEFARLQEERRSKDDEKTRKNREKREKAKKRKARAKEGTPTTDQDGEAAPRKKFAKGPRPAAGNNEAGDDVRNEKEEAAANGEAAHPEESGITILDDD